MTGFLRQTRALWREGRALHQCGAQELRVQLPGVQRALPDRVCVPSDPACTKLEVNDTTAQLELPGSCALDLDLIGALWLEL